MRIILSLVFTISLFTSCGLYYNALGFRKPKKMSDEKLIKYAEKLKIAEYGVYEMDTAYFYDAYFGTKDTVLRKNLIQPLQVIYFDSLGASETHLINCYIAGGLKLDWNRYGSFDTYPPTTSQYRYPDTILQIDKILPYIKTISGEEPIFSEGYKEVLLVYYNHMLHANSKRLVRLIKGYSKQHPHLRVLFINTDDAYYYLMN